MNILESKVDPLKKIIYGGDCHFYTVTFFPKKIQNTLIVCISSQVGCMEKCLFCATGNHKFIRNLTSEEIYNEIIDGIECNDSYIRENNIKYLQIAFEGMGEAYHNIVNCFSGFVSAYPVLSNKFEKIVLRISSVGNVALVEEYKSFVKEHSYMEQNVEFEIKFSLHTPFDSERKYLFPSVSNQLSIKSVIEEFYKLSDYLNSKLICNYVLFQYPSGENNYTTEHFEELSRILIPEKTKILLGYYADTNRGFEAPDETTYIYYRNLLKEKYNVETEIVKLLGRDVNAACGMLNYQP